jgi:hypothetical protein
MEQLSGFSGLPDGLTLQYSARSQGRIRHPVRVALVEGAVDCQPVNMPAIE